MIVAVKNDNTNVSQRRTMIELPWFIGGVSAYEIKDRRVRSCTLAEQIKKFNLYLIICIPLFCELYFTRGFQFTQDY